MVSLFLLCSHYLVGKQIESDDVVIGFEEVIDMTRQSRRRFGTASAFPIVFREAWKRDIHVFAAEGGKLPFDAETQRLGPPARVAVNVLNLHPVEVLAIEEQPNITNQPSSVFG